MKRLKTFDKRDYDIVHQNIHQTLCNLAHERPLLVHEEGRRLVDSMRDDVPPGVTVRYSTPPRADASRESDSPEF